MSLRTKFSLMTAGLIGAVVFLVAFTMIRSQKDILQDESRQRLETLMDGVGRIAQESVDSQDELMLISYLKYLKRERPEVRLAEVTRRGRTNSLGKEDTGLLILSRTAVEKFPVTYTVTAYSKAGAPAADVSVSSAGLSLNVHGDAMVKMTQEGKPDLVEIRLGFLRSHLQAEVRKRVEPMVRRVIAIAGVFMGLGMFGAMMLGKLLTSPLAALTAAVGAVGRGNLDTTVTEHSKDEVGLLEHRFNEMTGRIKDLMSFREDILHTLTHELNTPLAGLKGYLELWQEKKLAPEAQAEVVGTMNAAVLRMESSLGSALRLFQGPAGLAGGPRKLIWVDDVFDHVLTLLAPVAGANRITIHGLHPTVTECLYADEDLLRQIAANLVSNAIKYTPEGGEIRISLISDDDEVRFSVADNGRGIKAEDIPHLFTKFYRAGGSAERIPGTGLGLSIAHKAVTAMGGSITVESQPGKGSNFTVTLPKRPMPPQHEVPS